MKLLLVLLSVIATACGYHILCIQSVPSKSHYLLMKGIVDPLLKAGHQVTFVSTFPDPKPVKNLKYLDVSHIKMPESDDWNDSSKQSIAVVKELARNISRDVIQTPSVKEAILNQKFDAIVTEWFFSDVDAGYAAVQQVPWILLSGIVIHTHIENLVDTARSVPTIPAFLNESPIPMNFGGRVMNTFAYLFMTIGALLDHSLIKSNYETTFTPIAKARGVTLPPFEDALHNISIVFVNSHPSFSPAQSLPPNVVEIGGYHISEEVAPLPKDLQDILDSSPQGVIYFSMGSILKASVFPEQSKRDLIKIFSEMPYTVLWKLDENIDGLPKNVHIRSWMPQSSILAHKNVKVFITHGGLLSTLESVKFGIPVIALPVFGDQPANAVKCVQSGYALMIKYSADIAEPLKSALTEIMTNDRYYKRAKYLAKLFSDRPANTTHLIQHYVRLAIESRGAPHLRSKTLLYSWYQLWMLDQFALLAAILYVIYRVFKKIVSLFRKEKTAKNKKEKRN